MNVSDFGPYSPGKLAPTTFYERTYDGQRVGSRAIAGVGFVPDPLPPKEVDIGALLAEIHPALIAAERKITQLAVLGRSIKNPLILMGPLMAREAKLSSAIENTYASAQQLALFEVSESAVDSASRSEVREVRNYSLALYHGFRSTLPLCQRLFLEMHSILFADVRRDAGIPGEFRKTQIAIGSRTTTFEKARFVPPPPEHLNACIKDLEKYMNTADESIPDLVRLAFTHYQFECIHPFDDGNGRLGRLIIALQLCKQGLLPLPLLYISGFFEANREDYYRMLYEVSTKAAWTDWVKYFLTAVVTQATDSCQRAQRLLDLRDVYQSRVREKRSSGMLPKLIDWIFECPAINSHMIQEKLHVSPATASKYMRKLVEKKILVEVTKAKRNQIFEAKEILDITES